MNNNQYISTLKKALSGLDKTSRSDIVQEIQSHARESGDTLWERFGGPEELAQQYMEGEIVARPIAAKVWGVSKKLFIAVGMAVVALIVIAMILFWWLRLDAFNYADESAAELSDKSTSWTTNEWSGQLDIKLDQSSMVFYWHDEMSIRHSCKSKLPMQIDGSSLTFSRAKCLVYLPGLPTTINAHQSQLVLVRPQQSLDIVLRQAELKMAENGAQYRYTIDPSRTSVDDLSSVADADIEISIESFEAKITGYRY